MPTLVLSSLTPNTGNAVTAERIAGALGATTLALSSVSDGAQLRAALCERDADLVVGVHAYRSGRLLIGCGVPFLIVLGGTDMNVHLHESDKLKVMRQAVAEARAIVAFNGELLATLLTAMPDARDKSFVVPQAVASPLLPPPPNGAVDGAAADAITDAPSRADVRAALHLEEGDALLLLPAGLRPVKDVLFVADAIAQHRSSGATPRICLRIVGPVLDSEYAADVRGAISALAPSRAVEYVGPLPRLLLHHGMREALAVLNTSESEGMCNSILEAMLLGAPVVARANSGNSSLVRHAETGMLFSTPAECVACVRALHSEAGLRERVAAGASALVAREHSALREAEVYAEVLAVARR